MSFGRIKTLIKLSTSLPLTLSLPFYIIIILKCEQVCVCGDINVLLFVIHIPSIGFSSTEYFSNAVMVLLLIAFVRKWLLSSLPNWDNDKTMQSTMKTMLQIMIISIWILMNKFFMRHLHANTIHLEFNEQTHSLWMEFHNTVDISLILHLYFKLLDIEYQHFW